MCPTSSGSGKKLTLGLKENCCNIWCCNLKATSRGASHTLTSQILTKTTNSLTHAKICSSAVTFGESIQSPTLNSHLESRLSFEFTDASHLLNFCLWDSPLSSLLLFYFSNASFQSAFTFSFLFFFSFHFFP